MSSASCLLLAVHDSAKFVDDEVAFTDLHPEAKTCCSYTFYYATKRYDLSKLATQALWGCGFPDAFTGWWNTGTLFHKVSPKMTWHDNPFKSLRLCDLIFCKYRPWWEWRNQQTVSGTKIHNGVPELMSKIQAYQNLLQVRGDRPGLERKFTPNKSLIWSRLTSPPWKKTVRLWSGHSRWWNSCWQTGRGDLKARLSSQSVVTQAWKPFVHFQHL